MNDMETTQVSDPNSLNVYVEDTPARGRGVFARRRIVRDEVIERSPVIIIPEKQWGGLTETVLSNYVFDWGENDEHAASPSVTFPSTTTPTSLTPH